MTKKEATEAWVKEFNAIPTALLKKLYYGDCYDYYFNEITPVKVGDEVFVDSYNVGGIVENCIETCDLYLVNTDNGQSVEVSFADLEKIDESFPMWGTMWSFSDPTDIAWLAEPCNQQKMANCGFHIYETTWGYFFGIDGAGYDFIESHFMPLYDARGIHWHYHD